MLQTNPLARLMCLSSATENYCVCFTMVGLQLTYTHTESGTGQVGGQDEVYVLAYRCDTFRK